MAIIVTSALLEHLVAEARAAAPRECCGLLLGDDGAIDFAVAAANVHPTPETHFEIDPQVLVDAWRAMRGGGPRVVGYYHSHPSGPPEPSPTDQALALRDGMIWAIVSGGEVTLWRAGEDGFEPLPYRCAPA